MSDPVREDERPGADVRSYLGVLRRRKTVIVLAALVVTGVALADARLQTKVYGGTAQALLESRPTDTLFNGRGAQTADPAQLAQTESRLVDSQAVKDQVRAQLGVAPRISAGPVGQTAVISISARSTIPSQAAAVANTYAEVYVAVRRTQAVQSYLAATRELQAKITDLQNQINALAAQVDAAPPERRANFQSAASGLVPTGAGCASFSF